MTTVITAYDHTGKKYWCAAESEFLRDGLANGTLTVNPAAKPALPPALAPAQPPQDDEPEQEVTADAAAEDAPQAEGGDAKPRQRRSSQRKSN